MENLIDANLFLTNVKYSTTLAFLFLNYDGFEKILLQYGEQEKPNVDEDAQSTMGSGVW